MKTMILFRFAVMPNPAVSEVLSQHMEGKGELMQIPGAVITIFHTKSELSEIDQQLKMTVARGPFSAQPVTYILTDITSSPFSIALPEPANQALNAFVNQYKQGGRRSAQVQSESLNSRQLHQLLDQAVVDEDYEEAARLRDRISKLDQ